ncbi:MAG: helix-turn-helix transcriptional regulator [Sphaerochaetaceae bacterium]|nr:helix-turn-helix transcriptional regulator [Sphaerochaetaceae bacterium]
MIDLSSFLMPLDLMLLVAENEKKLRKRKKMTQQDLSIKSTVSLGSIKRFERTGEISIHSLILIAYALECQEDFLKLFTKPYFETQEEFRLAKL